MSDLAESNPRRQKTQGINKTSKILGDTSDDSQKLVNELSSSEEREDTSAERQDRLKNKSK